MLEHHPVDSGGRLGELAELLDVVVLAHEGGGGQLPVRAAVAAAAAAAAAGPQPGVGQHVARAVPLTRVLANRQQIFISGAHVRWSRYGTYQIGSGLLFETDIDPDLGIFFRCIYMRLEKDR